MVIHKYRLSRDQRIAKHSEYQSIYTHGKRTSSDVLRIHAVTTGLDIKPKFGIAVNKKIGKASVRNLIKRRLREIFRLHQFQIKPGSQIVIVAKPGCTKLDYQEMEQMVLRLLQKLKLIIESETTSVG